MAISNIRHGARLSGENIDFCVWAPKRELVAVVFEDDSGKKISSYNLTRDNDGYHHGSIPEQAEKLYRYKLDGNENLYADPASFYQPFGPFGPSQIIDQASFNWRDQDWKGIPDDEHVLYEMHIGTFTEEGTWRAAARELTELKNLGVTTIEMMPIADFAGRYGWGYDGVNLYAPTRLYGSVDDLKYFINHAHELGMAVILDVVYNHIGPSGNYFHDFADDYFSAKYKNDWGEALNFDGENSVHVREFFIQNALYWMEEFHFDGLRLDATQDIKDASEVYIVQEIIQRARELIPQRHLYFVAENESQNSKFLDQDGYGVTAMWNDDFHHTALVALTGRSEAYYTDYKGSPQEFISAAKYGFLYQGQRYEWQEARRGSPALSTKPHRFVHFIENHDQIANSGRGYRVSTIASSARYRAISAFLLLSPQTPMLFQGQEFASSRPFYYFADHEGELAQMVAKGRAEFLAQFPSLMTKEMSVFLPDPGNPQTFVRSKLNLKERETNPEIYRMYKDLLKLRREDKLVRNAKHLDGAVLGPEAFVLRYFGEEEDRLLLVNFGRDLSLRPAPEPLLAPMKNKLWQVAWSSESPEYGGTGTAHPDSIRNWYLPGHSTIWMKPALPREVKLEDIKSGAAK